MTFEDAILQTAMNYGIAGLILIVFYKLFDNRLAKLEDTINNLNTNITKLITILEVKSEKQ